ncbi:MAG TPA: GyrI-like domain-containing protein [Lachnospiraceae bacterium]|nr:GyrI-like domain-containing protein [Lachnospiraceae bacterium]
MKQEWKKHEKELYGTKEDTALLTIPRQKYFTITGVGNPNEEDFSERVGVLYSLAYAVRMMPKSGFTPEGYNEYTVYPLEGIWECIDDTVTIDKSTLRYKIMIRQPDFVTEEVAQKAFEITRRKKPHRLLNDVVFEELEDGLCVQILHVGTYDDEPHSFHAMKEYMLRNHLERKTTSHREIYIMDARKSAPEKLKTILRYSVRYRIE